MSRSLFQQARQSVPIAGKPQKARTLLAETYLNLIECQNRRLAVEERAIEEERLYLAELPEHITDLEMRLANETNPELRAVLTAKLKEAREELKIIEDRMIAREARWPACKEEMMAGIVQFHEKLGQSRAQQQG